MIAAKHNDWILCLEGGIMKKVWGVRRAAFSRKFWGGEGCTRSMQCNILVTDPALGLA
jgi:hypothetical protein